MNKNTEMTMTVEQMLSESKLMMTGKWFVGTIALDSSRFNSIRKELK